MRQGHAKGRKGDEGGGEDGRGLNVTSPLLSENFVLILSRSFRLEPT